MIWLISFFENVFGSFWERLGEWSLKLIMGPVVFYLFGPIFKVSQKIAVFILSSVVGDMKDVGLLADSLMGWFIDCLRLQDCVTSFVTFLVMGFTVSLLKKVF